MSKIIDDNFNGDTVGTAPSGWLGISGGGAIQNLGVPPPHTGPNHCVGLTGQIAQIFAPISSGAISFSYLSSALPTFGDVFNLRSSGVGGDFDLIRLRMEQDLSLSAFTSGGFLIDSHTGLPANSNVVSGVYTYAHTFNFYQAVFVVVENLDHSIQVSLSLIINGQPAFDATLNSGIFTTQCPASIIRIAFNNATIGTPGALLDNVVLDDDSSTGYPYPGLPETFQALTSQLVVEHLDLPSDQKIRVSQLAFERLSLPSDQRIRLSQLVIEIIQAKAPAPAGGWHVKEM